MPNLEPKKWGPHMWRSLHSITFAYPDNPTEEDKINYKSFFNFLSNVLPCESCRQHYKENITCGNLNINNKEIFESRDNLTKWLYELHNLVNKQTNKNIVISYKEVVKDYLSMAGGGDYEDNIINNNNFNNFNNFNNLKIKRYKLTKS